jgi:hypothetical protein
MEIYKVTLREWGLSITKRKERMVVPIPFEHARHLRKSRHIFR